MAAWEDHLRGRGVPGYHLYPASFHPLGVQFCRKLGLEEHAAFEWRLHAGTRWLTVTERVFVRAPQNAGADGAARPIRCEGNGYSVTVSR